MTASSKPNAAEQVACVVGTIVASAGWWFLHSAFWFEAVACIGLLMFLRAVRRRERGMGWLIVAAAMVNFGAFSALESPTYAGVAQIGRSVENCIPFKGTVQACLDEAETLYGYQVSADDLDRAVDWRAAFKSCVAHCGARSCFAEFALNGVARNGAVLAQDVTAICASSPRRTDCLLDLAANGYPLLKVTIPKEGLDGTTTPAKGFEAVAP
jgi:hypothetical protein